MDDLSQVYLGNFDVEEQWARGEPGLPAPSTRGAAAVAAATGELALLIAAESDLAVLKHAPEPEMLQQLEHVGLAPPRIAVPEAMEPERPVTLDALDSPDLLGRLSDEATGGARLNPHGYSEDEARLCDATGLGIPMRDPDIAKRVNGKVFSRRLCAELDIASPPGWECETIDELTGLADQVRSHLDAGRPVGFKASYGVSGKGIMVCEHSGRFDQLLRLLTRRAERSGDGRIEAVIESWQDKETDLNYHFTVADDGTVEFDFVLEAITENGTHRGHRLPDSQPRRIREALTECAHRIGARLAGEGYRGPVGVDAIICRDGTLYPVIEINARNNMSTYLAGIATRLEAAGSTGVAVQIDLPLTRRVPYREVGGALADLALDADWRRGFLVTCAATLNAAAPSAGDRFKGRLHGLVAGRDAADAAEVERQVRKRLGAMGEASV
ncbi:preATP grasp domain-containing protein [Glycomyces xiaoerkulensis]|uniref:preATP grasp domain-containing protein n=1 Tax=Glycomyces xiaoerkulensis TaxID=2038139 RepID=UPI000C26A35F|nr:hypothetical protein [Glycomyces xiaoerkulensis]